MVALIANGWFLGVKSFVYSPGVAPPPVRFMKALARWPVFIALWVTAFVYLPPLWVSLGLATWLAWIFRDIRKSLGRMDIQEEIKTRP